MALGKVTLSKEDGTNVELPLERLSADDQQWIEDSARPAPADRIEVQNGNSLECDVLQESATDVTILYHSSVLRMPRSFVASVVRDPRATESTSTQRRVTTRLADHKAIVVTVAAEPWASDFRQIPATVIAVGVMRNVPYKSHRAGGDYEINAYGDPDSPAGFEIGVRGGLLNDDQARQNCIECACKLLGEVADQQVVRGMSLEKDLKVHNGLTFEITPPTAPDAYGGWWVSIYDEQALNAARASEEEMKAITVARSSIPAPTSGERTVAAARHPDYLQRLGDWSTQDLRFARAPTTAARSGTGGGSVYVRSYSRKNGTYVQSYSRSTPHRK
jgi:hypothetical protein